MGGITLYTASMWVAGIMQGLMWREFNAEGYLVYSFAEVTAAMHPYYLIRLLGGAIYLAGALLMVWNVWMTALGKERDEAPLDAGAPHNPHTDRPQTDGPLVPAPAAQLAE
jgi:cytochrome c oxidase cbb3-type subunit 1